MGLFFYAPSTLKRVINVKILHGLLRTNRGIYAI
jgi:hypothetical protein